MGFALKNVLGLHDFGTAFWFFLALGEGLGLFDLVVIDLLWWRNTKHIRFSFLPDYNGVRIKIFHQPERKKPIGFHEYIDPFTGSKTKQAE